MEYLLECNPSKVKDQKWLQDEHNRSFTNWLRDKVYVHYTRTSNTKSISVLFFFKFL